MNDESLYSTRPSYKKISLYVVAHADDWQLFMQPNAYMDIVSKECKTVFIVTTAGDAGLGEKFWRAREEGCKSSVRFGLAPFGNIMEAEGTASFAGHIIHYWSINNVVVYFLRLPDGSKDGSGFASKFESLFKLKEGVINTIGCLDQSASYDSWPDFICTLRSIIDFELEGMTNVWVNYLNPDLKINPGDHSDHIVIGEALQNIMSLSNFHHKLHVGYSSVVNQTMLSWPDAFWKIGMFAAYEQTVYAQTGYSTLREDIDIYLNWCRLSTSIA